VQARLEFEDVDPGTATVSYVAALCVVEKPPGDKIRMRVQFMVPLEFPGYTYEWEFDLRVDRSIYIF